MKKKSDLYGYEKIVGTDETRKSSPVPQYSYDSDNNSRGLRVFLSKFPNYEKHVNFFPSLTFVNHFLGLTIHIDEDDDTTFRSFCSWCCERFFTLEKLKRRFPIVTWLPNYSFADLGGDISAGIS